MIAANAPHYPTKRWTRTVQQTNLPIEWAEMLAKKPHSKLPLGIPAHFPNPTTSLDVDTATSLDVVVYHLQVMCSSTISSLYLFPATPNNEHFSFYFVIRFSAIDVFASGDGIDGASIHHFGVHQSAGSRRDQALDLRDSGDDRVVFG